MNSNEKLRKDLLNSMEGLFSRNTHPALLSILKKTFPRLTFALIIKCIPEQAEDIYWIIIDLERIAIIEVPRIKTKEEHPPVEIIDINTYKKQISSKESRRMLAAAIELMKEHRKNSNQH